MLNVFILGGRSRLAKFLIPFFDKKFRVISIVNRPNKKNEFSFLNLNLCGYTPDIVIDCIRPRNYQNIYQIKQTILNQKRFIDFNIRHIQKYFILSSELSNEKISKLDRNNYNNNYIFYKQSVENILSKIKRKLIILRLKKIVFDYDKDHLKSYKRILNKFNFIFINNNVELIYYKSIIKFIDQKIRIKFNKFEILSIYDRLTNIERYELLNKLKIKYKKKYYIFKSPKYFNIIFRHFFFKYYETCLRREFNTINKKIYISKNINLDLII